MKRSPLGSYEGQIKIVLGLLVLFLAAAILLNVQLLVVARDAIQDETGRRLLLEADLVRVELERDQMLRGFRDPIGAMPYIPPTFLDRLARLKGMTAVEILNLDGHVMSSSDASRVGGDDPFLAARDDDRRRLLSGAGVLSEIERGPRLRRAHLAAYRPIQDRSRATIGIVRVQSEVPVLAAVHFNLMLIAAVQAGSLVFLVALVVGFARWLMQPYRRLMRAAGQAPGALAGIAGPASRDEPDWLVGAFQGVLDRLRDQEGELQRLKRPADGLPDPRILPGDHLVGGMSSAVLVFDREGRLTVLNPAAETLLGLQRSSAIGRKYGDLIGGARRLVELVGRSLGEGESFSREVVPLAGPGGRAAHLGAMVSPIRSGAGGPGEPIEGVLCLLADLTEIKTLRERVGIRDNLAALGEMSAGIAHEFRNALATIQGLARLIVRGLPADGNGHSAARENAETILREVRDVEKVVQDFLQFARPEHLDLAPVEMETIVRDLARDLKDDPRCGGIRIAVEGIFPPVWGDPRLLRQALQNLVRNAAEAIRDPEEAPDGAPSGARRGRGRIVIRGEPSPERGSFRLVVEDDGPGIPAEDLPRIFTPFFTTKDRGTGLGLAIVQKIAVLHDGIVEADNRPEGGARLAIVLPERPGSSGSTSPV